MVNIIKRGGFREQAARQLKYKNSVNQRTNIKAQAAYQPLHEANGLNSQADMSPTEMEPPATEQYSAPIIVQNQNQNQNQSPTASDADACINKK